MKIEDLPKADRIICVASWEPRFLEGVKKDLALTDANECIVFYAEEFASKSRENIDKLGEYCASNDIKFLKSKLFYMNPLTTRNTIVSAFDTFIENDRVLVDITTATRETMWFILEALSAQISNFNYIYWRPEKTANWTSKNSSKPRLVIGRAGVSEYGKPTLVAVTTGFDRSRLDQMVGYFEPEEIILFIQDGDQFENHEHNVQLHEKYGLGGSFAKEFSIDSYGQDHGLKTIDNILSPYLATHNIVLASFGPKPSALALHKFAKAYPDVALAYTPALNFNDDYSVGIGECVWGHM